MKECCANCALRYDLKMSDYSHGGCKDFDIDNGFICMAFADERIAMFMVGVDENTGMCECFTERKHKGE